MCNDYIFQVTCTALIFTISAVIDKTDCSYGTDSDLKRDINISFQGTLKCNYNYICIWLDI